MGADPYRPPGEFEHKIKPDRPLFDTCTDALIAEFGVIHPRMCP